MSTFTYPLTIKGSSLSLTDEPEIKLTEDIRSAAETYQAERVMRPTYGRTVRVFDEVSPAIVQADIAATIDRDVTPYHPGLNLRLETTIADQGVYQTDIYHQSSGVAIALVTDGI